MLPAAIGGKRQAKPLLPEAPIQVLLRFVNDLRLVPEARVLGENRLIAVENLMGLQTCKDAVGGHRYSVVDKQGI